jgi:hypothetical protein
MFKNMVNIPFVVTKYGETTALVALRQRAMRTIAAKHSRRYLSTSPFLRSIRSKSICAPRPGPSGGLTIPSRSTSRS